MSPEALVSPRARNCTVNCPKLGYQLKESKEVTCRFVGSIVVRFMTFLTQRAVPFRKRHRTAARKALKGGVMQTTPPIMKSTRYSRS